MVHTEDSTSEHLYQLIMPQMSHAFSPEIVGQKINFHDHGHSSLPAEPFVELQEKITSYLTPADYGDSSYNEVHPLFPAATVL